MILAVESSCDESALALFSPEEGLAGEWVHSQIVLHGQYGGIVPDLASREHLAHFPRLFAEVAAHPRAGEISQVAVTVGPGLAGCLALGMAAAGAYALARGVPLVGVNHLRGHAFSPFIALHAADPAGFAKAFAAHLPHFGLLVSGGNTLAYLIERGGHIRLLAQTVDDAAGEALDKGAKLLGMPYPGGPLVEQCARGGNPKAFDFPRAKTPHNEDVRFSFSGLKTSLRYQLAKMETAAVELAKSDLCASYQAAVIDQLIHKCDRLVGETRPASMGLCGGVSNNAVLRETFAALARSRHLPLLLAQPKHTGDNAGMMAFAAWADPRGVLTGGALNAFHPDLLLTRENA